MKLGKEIVSKVYVCEFCEKSSTDKSIIKYCEERHKRELELEELRLKISSIKDILDLVHKKFPEVRVEIKLDSWYVVNRPVEETQILHGNNITFCAKKQSDQGFSDSPEYQAIQFLRSLGLNPGTGSGWDDHSGNHICSYDFSINLELLPKLYGNICSLKKELLRKEDTDKALNVYNEKKEAILAEQISKKENIIKLRDQISKLKEKLSQEKKNWHDKLEAEYVTKYPAPKYEMSSEDLEAMVHEILKER